MARERILTTRVTPDEGKLLDALATVTNTPLAEILRRYVLAGLESDTSPENLQKIQKEFDAERRKREAQMTDLQQTLLKGRNSAANQ